MWWNKKKSSEHALKELVDALSSALGPTLVSAILYGSQASGEFHEGRSDINVFLLLQDMSAETLDHLAAPLRDWGKSGHPMPVFIQAKELQAYADSLPIEFLDMQDHHKVIFGSDPLRGLKVDRSNLRSQCVQELSIKLLKLRQALVLVRRDSSRVRALLMDSLPSVLTLFRAALRLESEVPAGPKIVAAKELAQRAGADGDCLERLWDIHLRRATDNLGDLAVQYITSVEQVLTYLNRK